MEYVGLKQKLEKLLTEDLSNRTTIQDARRNLFLNTEGVKIQKELISQKELEINSLTSLVEKKKSILQQKDDEIIVLKTQVEELNKKLSSKEEDTQKEAKENKEFARLTIQNEEYAAKIRELIYHIDKQNTEIESLKSDVAAKADAEQKLGQLPLFEEKMIEFERLTEKLDLVTNSERTLKMLVATQNTEIEKHHLTISTLKAETEEIAAGWQQQQEQLVMDNATLQADLVLLNQQFLELQLNQVENTSEGGFILEDSGVEKEHLLSELQAVKHELEITAQQRDEKVVLLQSEINSLQRQLVSLQESITNETEEKQKLKEQLAELTHIVSEKEELLNSKSETSSDDDAFIDKLLSQVNLLNEQKNTFETLFETTEVSLKEATETLGNLTQVVENQKSAISDLEQSNKNIKLAQTLILQVKDKTAAKQAIDELIGEIERCIALLSE
jgi:chromosome segregation ATPase